MRRIANDRAMRFARACSHEHTCACFDCMRDQGRDVACEASRPIRVNPHAFFNAITRGCVQTVREHIDADTRYMQVPFVTRATVADDGTISNEMWSPLRAASRARAHGAEIAAMLVDAGADIRFRCERGISVLEHASDAEDPQVASMLLDRGACDASTSARFAVARGHDLLAERMLEEALRAAVDSDACGLFLQKNTEAIRELRGRDGSLPSAVRAYLEQFAHCRRNDPRVRAEVAEAIGDRVLFRTIVRSNDLDPTSLGISWEFASIVYVYRYDVRWKHDIQPCEHYTRERVDALRNDAVEEALLQRLRDAYAHVDDDALVRAFPLVSIAEAYDCDGFSIERFYIAELRFRLERLARRRTEIMGSVIMPSLACGDERAAWIGFRRLDALDRVRTGLDERIALARDFVEEESVVSDWDGADRWGGSDGTWEDEDAW